MMLEKWDEEQDVIIVGSGLAGLTAAIEAYDAGAKIVILEKRSKPGGNSIIAAGGANAVDPERQKPQGIEDSIDLHFKHTFEGGDFIGDPEKIRYFVEHALDGCVHWLEKMGVEWPREVVWGYGALWCRTHFPPRYKKYQRGAAIVMCLLDQVEKREIPLLRGHKVTRIIREKPLEGRVLGVEVEKDGEKLYFKARKAVIVASGGFAADQNMVKKHDPRLAELGSSNHPDATGECINFAMDIGADTLHMDYIQCAPSRTKASFQAKWFRIDSEETITSAVSCIFVNSKGKRFVSEDARRDTITFAGLKQTTFASVPKVEASTIEELEEKLGIPKGNLVDSIKKYNNYCDMDHDPEFGKHPLNLTKLITPPFKAEPFTLARHHTMGGLRIKGTTGRVIDRYERVIPGFYAAGEVTGGIHGSNRVGFNATTSCIIFGRTAGKNAATETAHATSSS